MRVGLLVRALLVAVMAAAIVGEEAATNKGTPIAFGTEVPKMLEILINSLYTNRNVFLREIISNGSDALDKVRVLYLTEPKEARTDSGDVAEMDMRIRIDAEKRQLVFRDGGVGMTNEDLGSNLGTLGASGTKRFLESAQTSEPFIGQFGVGFYSVFLVSERVRVASKSDSSDKQWVWESTGDGTYFIYEDPRGNTLGRGTELTLELKKDANEYLDVDKVKEVVHKHSEFIHFPIYIEVSKTESVKKPQEQTTGDGDAAAEDEGEAEEEVVRREWELINENKPIWTRKPSEIKEEEYNTFYKSLTKDFNDPLFYTHFSAEGEVEFKSVLFVPVVAPTNIFETTASQSLTNIQLYVRRVFITDDFKDLLPRYLSFVKGIVDSDDLPLNVSREVLQESRILKVIKKKLVRKALVMMSDIAQFDKDFIDGSEEKKGDDGPTDTSGNKRLTVPTYDRFWEEYGKNLRLGMIEDSANRARLTKLLRYKTSKSEGRLMSLEEYVSGMAPKQRSIYYLTGESIERIQQSPYLEDATKRNIEVLFMTDAIDEYVVGHITDFADKKLVNLAKEGVKFDEEGKREKSIETKRKEKYQPLFDWFKSLLGERVSRVTVTKRQTSEPLVIVSRQHDLTARMQRIMKGQALADKKDPEQQRQMVSRRVLELNHLHPLVDELYKRVRADVNDTTAADIAMVLFDTANLQSDFDVEDTQAFARRINRLVRQSVDIAPDASLLEEDLSQYDDDAEDEDDAEEPDDDAKAEVPPPEAQPPATEGAGDVPPDEL